MGAIDRRCRQNERRSVMHSGALQITRERERASQTLSLPATPPEREEETREGSGGRGAEISPKRSLGGTKVFQLCGLGRRISIFPGRSCVCNATTSRTTAEGAVRWVCGGAGPDHHGHSSWVKVELLASSHCAAGRTE